MAEDKGKNQFLELLRASDGGFLQQQGGQQSGGRQPGGRRNPSGQPSGAQQGRPDTGGGGLIRNFRESLGSGPITGDGFAPWSDRLRDVEEMIDDPELRSRAAQIRDRARNLRRDMKRRSKPPQWSLVEDLIATPLAELRQHVDLELARRSGRRDQLVPIDRDPVPAEFRDRVQRYYERLGQGD